MVFPSAPVYLDPPNWNQQQAQQPSGGGGVHEVHQLSAGPIPRSEPLRPATMADRARLAKVLQPEAALKCPRCDSSNTKFCYFNNYSLTQPRHFCKTCRRYWTRGGALRSVPVGGGCRRNKRSKSSGAATSSSKSQLTTTSSTSSTATTGAILPTMPAAAQLPFLPSLHPLLDYNTTNIGLNFAVDYQNNIDMEQWRIHQMQQFPLFAGLEIPAASAPVQGLIHGFDSEGGRFMGQVHPQTTSAGLITELASVKMEDSSRLGLNLSRQYPGVPRNDQYWSGGSGGGCSGGGGWMMDLSGFNCSSSSNLL